MNNLQKRIDAIEKRTAHAPQNASVLDLMRENSIRRTLELLEQWGRTQEANQLRADVEIAKQRAKEWRAQRFGEGKQ